MADSVDTGTASAEIVLQNLNRHLNCLVEENRNSRKRAIEGITKETILRKPALEPLVIQEVFDEILKSLLKIFADPVEKNRELVIALIGKCLDIVPQPHLFLPFLVPTLAQRLGQQEMVESSEEVRLVLVEMLSKIIDLSGKKIAAYLDDLINVLQKTIVDPYPEVKKESCRCASALAKSIPEHFHMQSETLIKPLLLIISHQHSKVRLHSVETIGDVIMYGNGKSVDDVVSHFAQRLFDQAPVVRRAVTQVVGNWLLDLPDRYSFHHRLIPLLLTSITDELPEIQAQADGLWHDVGLKYEAENESDLKDKQDFVKAEPTHYPAGIERPNLGCRTLVYRHFSKILPGLLADLGDWVAATRVKSAQLLYTLLLNSEDNTTQHMEKLLSGLCRSCSDEEKQVKEYVVKSAELVGYFVQPVVWVTMVTGTVKATQSYASLQVLAAIIRGSERQALQPHLVTICNTIVIDEVCRTTEVLAQEQLLMCIKALLSTSQEDCREFAVRIFTVTITVLALHASPAIKNEVSVCLEMLARAEGLSSVQMLFSAHTRQVITALQDGYMMWTQHSVERKIFDTLVMESGPVVGEILEDIIPMMVANLKPEKDAEMRLKFFSLLSRLMVNAPATLDSQQQFSDFAVTVVRDMVIPNLVWKAGRTAGAVRLTAMSCLWALLHSAVISKEQILEVLQDLLTQLNTCLEDAEKNTRLITCRSLRQLFLILGSEIDQDRLHFMYPELLKRLDDSSDEIRIAVARTFLAYFDCFGGGYDVGLYRAHLEAIYRGLLLHLDDPDKSIQESMLDVLKKAALLAPAMCAGEVEAVKHKHRSTKHCDALIEHIQNTAQQNST